MQAFFYDNPQRVRPFVQRTRRSSIVSLGCGSGFLPTETPERTRVGTDAQRKMSGAAPLATSRELEQMTTTTTPPPSLAGFAERLPLDYQTRFNPAEMAAHAYVVQQLGDAAVKVGPCPSRFSGMVGLCVCAEDRPGLLATIGAALSDLGYQVHAGEAYCFDEAPQGRRLALDIFWIAFAKGPVREEESDTLGELIEELLSGRAAPHIEQKRIAAATGGTVAEGTTVRFIEDAQGSLCVLEVETTDRGGLLYAISRALADAKVQIVGSHIRTRQGRVLDQFTLENYDGSSIVDEHRLEIQVAVLAALQI